MARAERKQVGRSDVYIGQYGRHSYTYVYATCVHIHADVYMCITFLEKQHVTRNMIYMKHAKAVRNEPLIDTHCCAYTYA